VASGSPPAEDGDEPGDRALLQPELVQRLAALEVEARVAAEGALAGLHRSPRRGSSVEFAEHKEYAPGDELRHVDWKTYGRSDRLYVKRFEEETELHALFVIDVSASMRYGEGRTDKLRFAAVVAAAMSYLLVTRRDRAGLLLSPGEAVPVGARPGHLRRILAALVAARSTARSGRADLPSALLRADALCKRRTQVVVLSDLLDRDADEVVAAARSLKARGHDPVLVQVLHPDEQTLPFGELAWYESPEGEARVLADPRAVAVAYLAELAALYAHYRDALVRAKIPLCRLDSSSEPVEALASLLRGPLARVMRQAP
jgi:uncharacterized protein (DUF58 family)